jgi:2-keto-4-pentenoate hydratase/2-oxohepta-3-ene-1,7-dioic acid hydratase in catechol pathway
MGVVEDGVVIEVDVPLDALHSISDRMLAAAQRRRVDEVTLLAPVNRPTKVLCVGINYVPHMEESKFDRPAEPIFFSKLPSTIVGPTEPIVLPAVAPGRVDYEAELVVVIGRRGRDIDPAQAFDHIAGFTVGNDVSARDWQLKKPGGQWLLGKSFDTFLPLGPWITTADELGDLGPLHVRCQVNGENLQDDVVSNLIFDIPTLISYVSRVATLEPGDLLMTGTPGGVGQSRTPPRWLQDGDVVETSIDRIGTLRNPVLTGVA